jgi:glyoxylase-like metal-dependent hydrolase (beta-lactamase superfamily II)
LLKKKCYRFRKWFLKTIFRIRKVKNVNPLPDKIIDNLEIIYSPGHTPGHVCYQYKDFIFVGDLFRTYNGKVLLMNDKFVFNKDDSIKSIKNIDWTNIKHICPAHGDVLAITSETISNFNTLS